MCIWHVNIVVAESVNQNFDSHPQSMIHLHAGSGEPKLLINCRRSSKFPLQGQKNVLVWMLPWLKTANIILKCYYFKFVDLKIQPDSHNGQWSSKLSIALLGCSKNGTIERLPEEDPGIDAHFRFTKLMVFTMGILKRRPTVR